MRWTGDEGAGRRQCAREVPAMHACRPLRSIPCTAPGAPLAMSEWLDWPDRTFGFFAPLQPPERPPPPAQQTQPPPTPPPTSATVQRIPPPPVTTGENPREIRNKAEKQRRDKLNASIAELAAMVPPVVAASRKVDKTGVLRLTAHFLRAHHYVFGESIARPSFGDMNSASAQALLQILDGFLLTTTYKGIVVVVSQNVQQFLGYAELDLLGQNIFTIAHKDDHKMLREHLTPRSQTFGPNGELIIPDTPDGNLLVADALAGEKRRFLVRLKRHSGRAEPAQYVSCLVEGSLRKSDRACRGNARCCQAVRRTRTRGDNPRSSGNDVVFIGIVRPTADTFKKASELEHFRMEYRTRHSIDGQIIQCEKRIALVTGYMTDEVRGVNAMNFMHRDDVRWVIIALREMYDQHRLYGESCYRLMMKNGQFIYMRTRGCLEVDTSTKAVTSFVCTNTVMNATDGQHLIRMMKKKFTMLVNNNEEPPQEPEVTDTNDESLPVEDPRQLEKVILHLVTNLPSPQPEEGGGSPAPHLAIIPPRKERIVSAIEKIYSVIKTFKNPRIEETKRKRAASEARIQELPQDEPLPLSNISTINKYGANPAEEFENMFPTPPSVETAEFDKPNDFAEYIVEQPHKESQFNFTRMDDDCDFVDLEQPGTSTSVTRMKRPNECDIEDGYFKKKMAQSEVEPEDRLNYGRSSPTLENFFNEAILNSQFSQIDAALMSMENTIDPSFPDFLICQDVQDILGELEYDPEKLTDDQQSPI